MAGSSSQIKEATPRSFDVSRFYGDPYRARNLLGWSAYFSFEEAVGKFLPNLKAHLQEEQFLLKRVAS
jgi:nucleoside-diphosphate-sugar epimerase